MRRDIQQVQAVSSGGRICRSEAVWDQEGVRPGGGRVHCAFALCAAPGLRQVGAAQGGEGGGMGANRLQVGVQSALLCAGLCWLGLRRGGGLFFRCG